MGTLMSSLCDKRAVGLILAQELARYTHVRVANSKLELSQLLFISISVMIRLGQAFWHQEMAAVIDG